MSAKKKYSVPAPTPPKQFNVVFDELGQKRISELKRKFGWPDMSDAATIRALIEKLYTATFQ